MSLSLAKQLVASLPSGINDLFNPWSDTCSQDQIWNGPNQKLQRLAAHIDCDPEYILCGEAPGYLGCRHTGLAFTSESLLLDGAIPRIPRELRVLTHNSKPLKEQSSTIVWRVLYDLQIAEKTILWNAISMHPHEEGNPDSNRSPRPNELLMGVPAMEVMINRFGNANIIAVGKSAESLLKQMGVSVFGCIRHPANGGATLFREGLAALVERRN